ncbi:MAG: hypothetical protein PWQ77_1127 [Kosmotogales bacterium]|nr:hypothetical protein [Kosmotogales bacterium]
MKNKDDILKKYSIKCNIILSVIFSILLNVTIYIISLIIKNHIFLNTYNWISFKYFLINFNNNSFTIYNTVIVSFIALYATVMAISSNLSQEFPFEIALKYIIKSNASLFYSFSIISNIVLVYIIPKNLLQVIFILGSIFLFIVYTVIYLFIFFNKFKIEKYIVYFISPKIEEFNDVRNCCKKCNIDGIKIVEDKETVFISKASYEEISKENFNKVKEYEIWFKRGLLKVDNWDFLKKIENKFWIQLKKYDLENYLFPNKAIIKIVINNENKKDEEFVAIDKILHNNIKYEFLNLDEFESVYEKLKRINQEERFISFSKKIIDNYFNNIYDKNLFYSIFSEYFEKNSIDEIGDPLEYEFDIVITQFYLQQNEYYSSPKIISNIQKKLMKIIYKAFKYKNKKVCMNSGLYIKELTGYKYKDTFAKSNDKEWINEYNYLMQICLKNFITVIKLIIDSDFENEFKIKCLKDNINTYLDFFDLEFSSNYNYYNLDNKKINGFKKAILEYLNKIYKINLFKTLFLILYKIQELDLDKSFFNIAIDLYKLKKLKDNFNKYLVYESNEYEELKDEFDVYIFDEIRDSSVWIGENNVDLIHFLFILLFNGYLNDVNKEININIFSREYFSDNLLINELNNFTEGYARKFFDFESTDFENFKEKFEENIQNKIETTVSELNDYLSTPLENEEKFDFKKLEKCINEEFDLKEKRNKELLEYEYIGEIGNENNFEEKIIYNMNFEKEWFLEPFFKNKEIFFISDYFLGKKIGMEKYKEIINFIIDKVENESQNDAIRINEDNFVEKIDEFTNENYKYILFSSIRLFNFLYITYPENIKSGTPLYYNFEINNKSILVIINICNDKNVLYSKDSFSLHQHLYTDDKPIEFMYSEISDNDVNKKVGKTNQEIPPEYYKMFLKIKVQENYEIICNDLKNTWLLELIFD